VRGFWRGNPASWGMSPSGLRVRAICSCQRRRPTASINYVACHDGFTLYDTVAYEQKHNEAISRRIATATITIQLQLRRRGESDDPNVLELRERQIRNLLATLFLSQGVPMLQAGDELGRTQRGNNNAYCQDNEISWIDWTLATKRGWLLTFVRQLLALRKQAQGLRRDTFLKGARQLDREHKDVSWRHPDGHELTAGDWHDANARALGVLIGHAFTDPHGTPNGHLLFLCNAGEQQVTFVLPKPRSGLVWQVVFDTFRWRANDLGNCLAAGENCALGAHSCVLLADGDAPLNVRVGFQGPSES